MLETACRNLERRLRDTVASGQRHVLGLEAEIRRWEIFIEQLSEKEKLADGGGLDLSMDT